MKRTYKRLASILLALALASTLALPASARSWNHNAPTGNSLFVWLWKYAHGQVGETCPPDSDLPSVEKPDAPSQPDTPTTPDVPSQPDQPTKPDVPSQPDKPTTPDVPSQPDKPTTPDVPSQPSGSVSALERQVVTLVNQKRAANGLPALTLSEQLCSGARLKSQDMRNNRYFDHNSPTYGSPFDMMRSLGITYSAAGENIAMGYSTAEAVVNAWMNSPGHRANILSSSYTHIGVGYVANGGYWTQWFTR